MDDGLPGTDAVRSRERRDRGSGGDCQQPHRAPYPALSRQVLSEYHGGERAQRGQPHDEAAMQIRPQRENRNREPYGGAATVVVAGKNREDGTHQGEGEDLRSELEVGSQGRAGGDEDGELDARRRFGFLQRQHEEQDRRSRAGELHQLESDGAEGVVYRGHQDFAQPFMVEPQMSRRRIRIRIVKNQLALREHVLSESHVTP